MKSQKKAIYFRKINRQKIEKLITTDESRTGFNFSRNRHKHAA